jgi:lysophospholipase L1-like esterase
MVTFVALGDSITVGLGDPQPGGAWRGWAALLAEALAPPGRLEFYNMAELGAQTHTLADRQLDAALALRPDLASVVVGVNDTLRGTFDVHRVGLALDRVVGQLHATGAVVLTARLPDPARMLGVPGWLAQPLARRIRAVNAMADAVARRYGTVHLDLLEHPQTYDRPMWSIDRLHPSERGHRLLAASFADLLTARGIPLYDRPGTEPTSPPTTRRAEFTWMATRGTRWLLDRATDLVPYLVAMAAREWWNDVHGRVQRADEQLDHEIGLAVARLRGNDSSTVRLTVSHPLSGALPPAPALRR